jgi:hypothetical protein
MICAEAEYNGGMQEASGVLRRQPRRARELLEEEMKNKKIHEQSIIILKDIIKSMLVFLPFFTGLAIFTISGGNMVLFSLGGFVAGISGIIIILRKEIPTIVSSVRGTRAIVEGIIITSICWGSSIIILFEGIRSKP